MGLPARRIESEPRSSHRAPRLTLVEPRPRREARADDRRAASARRRAQEARARTLFGVFMVGLIAAVALGGARVTLIQQAAQASISGSKLQAQIAQARTLADQLEVDKSALSAPSRIAQIASTQMGMGAPLSVRYITLATAGRTSLGNTAGHAVAAAAPTGASAVVSAVMDLSAGEAQSLLVGDLGLAGSR